MRNVQHNATAAASEGRGKKSWLVRIQNGSGRETGVPPVVNYNSNCNSAAPERCREAEGGGLLILPALFVLTDFRMFCLR